MKEKYTVNKDKERLIDILKENDEEKIQEFLLKNGKKKSYCPIYIKKHNAELES